MGWAAACGAMAASLVLASCGGSGSGTQDAAGRPSTSATDLTPTTIPTSPAGHSSDGSRLGGRRTVVRSGDRLPLRRIVLDKISAANINAVLAELPATKGTLVDWWRPILALSWPSPVSAQRELNVSLSVNGSGLIDGLRLTPSVSVSSWSLVDQTLAAMAPNVELSRRPSIQRVLPTDPPGGFLDTAPIGVRVQALRLGRVGQSGRRRQGGVEPGSHGREPAQGARAIRWVPDRSSSARPVRRSPYRIRRRK